MGRLCSSRRDRCSQLIGTNEADYGFMKFMTFVQSDPVPIRIMYESFLANYTLSKYITPFLQSLIVSNRPNTQLPVP